MPKLMKKAISLRSTDGRTNSNYRKASLFKKNDNIHKNEALKSEGLHCYRNHHAKFKIDKTILTV